MIIALKESQYCPLQSYHDTNTGRSYWIPPKRNRTLPASPMAFVLNNGVKILQPPCFTKK